MRKSKNVSLTLPLWVIDFFEDYQWKVHVAKPELMRRILSEYAKMKVAEAEEEQHPSPGPFEDSDTEES